jgi:lipopolysaccharide/colanic/teichoic acid biosynthesis glycosyltransferase
MPEANNYLNGATKRIVDLVLGLFLGLATIPFLALALVLSAISFRAWPVFSQLRLGKDGQTFNFYKVRSLPKRTVVTANKYEVAEIKNTRVGTFLRKSHFDDLPQLWMAVTGTMSLVGPRPELPNIAAGFDADFIDRRTRTRPGVTGAWQLSTATLALIGESPEFDDFYLTNASLRFDLWLLWQTVGQQLGAKQFTMGALRKFTL